MTRILVLYGTTDGQTEKVAQVLGLALRRAGADASVFKASPAAPGPEDYTGVIVAASLRVGKYQRPVRRWIAQHADALNYTRYDWLTRWIMKRIVAKAGGNTDTSRDHEYTDWADVRAFAREFLNYVKHASLPEERVVA